MNKIEKMIQELCPDGVEWRELGEVCDVANNTRKPVKASLRIPGRIPYYGANNIQDYVDGYTHDGEYVLIAEDGSASLENYSIQWASGKFWANNHVHIVRGKTGLDNRFLFHYLQFINFIPYLSGSGRAKLTKSQLLSIKLPIPPLEIQKEIVQILDKFTDYVIELTAELTLRQKQYSFYRDKLLSFEDEVYEVEWKTLGEVCVQTHNISWSNEREDKEYEYVDLSSVDRENKTITATTTITKDTAPSRAQKLILENDILFGTTRPTLQRYTKVPVKYSGQVCSTGFCVLRASKEIESNYLYHMVASSRFNDYVTENQSGTSYPAISDNLVKNFRIPVPSLDIQNRIVQVLDNFDAVCNDLNIGLPKEIELRQKQYEYFRDKLLTFTAEGVYTDSTVQTRPN